MSLLAFHPGFQLLEGSCQAPAVGGQHSMLSRQHLPQLVSLVVSLYCMALTAPVQSFT